MLYLNIETHAVDWVKDHVEVRRNMRRARRFRNTPCGQNRTNRLVNKNRIPHLQTGKRVTQNAVPADIKFLAFNSWRLGE